MGIDLSQIEVDEETGLSIASFVVTALAPTIAPGATISPPAGESAMPIVRSMMKMSKGDHFSEEELEALMKVLEEQSALIQKDPDDGVQGAPV